MGVSAISLAARVWLGGATWYTQWGHVFTGGHGGFRAPLVGT